MHAAIWHGMQCTGWLWIQLFISRHPTLQSLVSTTQATRVDAFLSSTQATRVDTFVSSTQLDPFLSSTQVCPFCTCRGHFVDDYIFVLD